MNGKEKDFIKEVGSWILYILFIIGVTYLIITFVGQRTKVDGSSMETTLSDGDNLIVDKISYRFHDPERYDIIVFPYRYAEKTYYIKRIIGMPGETVQLQDGEIYINDQRMIESYGLETYLDAGIASEPLVLGPDEYFVLGDNRNDSRDSRSAGLGPVQREQIVGRVLFRIWPFSEIGKVK